MNLTIQIYTKNKTPTNNVEVLQLTNNKLAILSYDSR